MEDKGDMYKGTTIMHKERVSKNPDRVQYAMDQFKDNNIKFELKNECTCHFHTWRRSDEKLFQFWAGTGKIMGSEERGIHNLVKILME